MSAKLHFDGLGLNDAENRYKPRVATFTSEGYAKQFGSLLEAAPDMLAALRMVAWSGNFTCFQDAGWDVVNAAIAKAEGK